MTANLNKLCKIQYILLALIVLVEQIREKSKGRNHDLSVMEYKVLKEEIRYDELKEQADEKQQENEQLERVKEANERADRIEAYIKTQSDTLVDL